MIRIPEVRLIDHEGNQAGVVPTDKARTMAREVGMDLVEISPTAKPPVCKIMDYGRFKYEQKKKNNESRKRQHNFQVKELRVRPKTGQHDIDVRLRKAREFLEAGDKVQLMVFFKGREVVHNGIGLEILRDMAEKLADVGKVERPPRLEGKRMQMVLVPIARNPATSKPAGPVGAPGPARPPRPVAGPTPPIDEIDDEDEIDDDDDDDLDDEDLDDEDGDDAPRGDQ